jgi:hypothetical protein
MLGNLFGKKNESKSKVRFKNVNSSNISVNSGSGKTTISSKSISGRNIQIVNNRIVVDGNDITDQYKDQKVINIQVDGDVQTLEADGANQVTINGSVGSAKSGVGDISITGNCGPVVNGSGDVKVGGGVAGNIQTGSGDVSCGEVSGSVKTGSGDINTKPKFRTPRKLS